MGSCQCGDPAPFLTEYFSMQEALVNEGMAGDNAFEMLGKIGENKKKKEKMKKKLVGIIENAFAHHDSDEDDVLDEEEADEFFEHFVERCVEFQWKTGLKALDMSTAMQASIAGMLGGNDPEMKAMMKEEMEEGKKELRKQRKKRLQNYRDNQERLHEAAFNVLDTNKNGTLERDEVVKALIPETDEWTNLLLALELISKEDAQLANMAQATANDLEGCSVQ